MNKLTNKIKKEIRRNLGLNTDLRHKLKIHNDSFMENIENELYNYGIIEKCQYDFLSKEYEDYQNLIKYYVERVCSLR